MSQRRTGKAPSSPRMQRGYVLPTVMLLAAAFVIVTNVALKGWRTTMANNQRLEKRIQLEASSIRVLRQAE